MSVELVRISLVYNMVYGMAYGECTVWYGVRCDTMYRMMYGTMYEHQGGHRPAAALITKPTCNVNSNKYCKIGTI